MSNTITNELILEEIKKNRQELKSTIEALEVRILMKIEETNHKLIEIEKDCANLSAKIEQLEVNQKKNNVVIFGLHKLPSQITLDLIKNEIKNLLDIDLNASDINNFYPLGKQENCPVKLELVTYLKKASILENAKKLKGTNVSIANDMTFKQRMEHKILRKYLNIAKQNKENICYIKGNKLHVNNETYSPQDLENSEDPQDNNKVQSTSEPGTPIASKDPLSIPPSLLQFDQNKQNNSTSSTPRGFSKGKKEGKENALKRTTKEDRVLTRSKK